MEEGPTKPTVLGYQDSQESGLGFSGDLTQDLRKPDLNDRQITSFCTDKVSAPVTDDLQQGVEELRTHLKCQAGGRDIVPEENLSKRKRFDHLDYKASKENVIKLKTTVASSNYVSDSDSNPTKSIPEFACQAPGCTLHFESTKEYDEHYYAKHRHVCCECKKCFPSEHLVGLHVQEVHDSFFKVRSLKQPMFECYLETCPMKFQQPEERFKHCVDEHKFPKLFRHSTSVRDIYPKEPKKQKMKNSQKNQERSDESKMEVEQKDGSGPMDHVQGDSEGLIDVDAIAAVADQDQEQMDVPALNELQSASKEMDSSHEISEKKANENTSQSTNKKSKGKVSHFTFGHSQAARFVPRQKFAMQKENKSKNDGANSATTATMDFTEVQKALLENLDNK